MNPQELRNAFIATKHRWGRNEATVEELYAAADAYIEAIKEFKKRTKNKKLAVPTRAYLLRAL